MRLHNARAAAGRCSFAYKLASRQSSFAVIPLSLCLSYWSFFIEHTTYFGNQNSLKHAGDGWYNLSEANMSSHSTIALQLCRYDNSKTGAFSGATSKSHRTQILKTQMQLSCVRCKFLLCTCYLDMSDNVYGNAAKQKNP